MKQAVIDIGTNTCLLLIAESDHVGKMNVLADVHVIARLGAGVDRTKNIQPESSERLIHILLDHKKKIDQYHVDDMAVIATSAMRDADNKDEIIAKIKSVTGFGIELLSGENESVWSYRGAICGLLPDEIDGRVATLDIGGGSTELSIGENGKYKTGKSINIGAVRMKERFLTVINDVSVSATREFIRSELKESFSEFHITQLIAVAGTPTALAAMKLKLQSFDAKKVNSSVLTLDELELLNYEILTIASGELIRRYPAIHKDRADILPAGALILEECMKYLKLNEVRVSTYGLRYGIMIREFERRMNAASIEWIVTRG